MHSYMLNSFSKGGGMKSIFKGDNKGLLVGSQLVYEMIFIGKLKGKLKILNVVLPFFLD